MAEEFVRVQEDINELTDQDSENYKSSIELTEMERIVLYLSDGDLFKRDNVLNTDYQTAMKFYYFGLVKKLNELKSYVSILKKREE